MFHPSLRALKVAALVIAFSAPIVLVACADSPGQTCSKTSELDLGGFKKCADMCFDSGTSGDDKSYACMAVFGYPQLCAGVAAKGGADWDAKKADCQSACEHVAKLPKQDDVAVLRALDECKKIAAK